MLINDLDCFERANYCGKISGMDTSGVNDYQYNSWAFRGPCYEQYCGQKVNICLGDSFTANIGGAIEHSWPSQLDIPTLNLGIDGAGNDAIALVYQRACDVFDVQHTFVMYSFLHRRLQQTKFVQTVAEDQENFDYFLKHRISDKYECALPSWCWTDSEYEFLKSLGIYFLDVPKTQLFADDPNIDRICVLEVNYNNLRGPAWPTYNEFIAGAPAHPDMLDDNFGNFLDPLIRYKNVDGFHLSLHANKLYSEYLHTQWNNYESQDII
jgi:hypothetical protein